MAVSRTCTVFRGETPSHPPKSTTLVRVRVRVRVGVRVRVRVRD